MLVRLPATFAVPRMSSQMPRKVAVLPTPTIVVFEAWPDAHSRLLRGL